MEFFSSKLFKYIIAAAAIVAIIGASLWLVREVYNYGKNAGVSESTAKWNDEKLQLQQALNKKQTEEAQQINDRIDKLLTLSQDGATAVELYTDQSKALSNQVLSTLKTKLLVTPDCKFTPDFAKAWEQIRKGSAK